MLNFNFPSNVPVFTPNLNSSPFQSQLNNVFSSVLVPNQPVFGSHSQTSPAAASTAITDIESAVIPASEVTSPNKFIHNKSSKPSPTSISGCNLNPPPNLDIRKLGPDRAHDLDLIFRSTQYRVHSIILEQSSTYFAALIQSLQTHGNQTSSKFRSSITNSSPTTNTQSNISEQAQSQVESHGEEKHDEEQLETAPIVPGGAQTSTFNFSHTNKQSTGEKDDKNWASNLNHESEKVEDEIKFTDNTNERIPCVTLPTDLRCNAGEFLLFLFHIYDPSIILSSSTSYTLIEKTCYLAHYFDCQRLTELCEEKILNGLKNKLRFSSPILWWSRLGVNDEIDLNISNSNQFNCQWFVATIKDCKENAMNGKKSLCCLYQNDQEIWLSLPDDLDKIALKHEKTNPNMKNQENLARRQRRQKTNIPNNFVESGSIGFSNQRASSLSVKDDSSDLSNSSSFTSLILHYLPIADRFGYKELNKFCMTQILNSSSFSTKDMKELLSTLSPSTLKKLTVTLLTKAGFLTSP